MAFKAMHGMVYNDNGDLDIRVDNADGNIAFDIDDYNSKSEMFAAIGQMMKILTDMGYVAICRWDDKGCGIFVIEYAQVGYGKCVEVLCEDEKEKLDAYRYDSFQFLLVGEEYREEDEEDDDDDFEFSAEL